MLQQANKDKNNHEKKNEWNTHKVCDGANQ